MAKPQINDRIEFMGDRFTDKGPATGTIVAVDGNKVSISFHDEVEEFDWKEVGPYADVRGRFWFVSQGEKKETAAMKRLNQVEARVETEMQLAADGKTWFDGLTKKQQDEYIALHPKSKYAKQYRDTPAAKETKKKQDKQVRTRGETVHREKKSDSGDKKKLDALYERLFNLENMAARHTAYNRPDKVAEIEKKMEAVSKQIQELEKTSGKKAF